MATPKKRTSSTKRRMRNSHSGLKKMSLPKMISGAVIRSHHMSPDGFYKGRLITNRYRDNRDSTKVQEFSVDKSIESSSI